MPIYAYVCKDCGHNFDLLVGVTSEKVELKCPKCGSKDIERKFASFGIKVSSGSKDSGSSYPTCPTGTCPWTK